MSPDPDAIVRAKQILEKLWLQHKDTILDRVAALETAAASASDLDQAARHEARTIAHKLAGSLGTFGYRDASDWAKDSEQVLAKDEITRADRDQLIENSRKIRALLEIARPAV